METSNSEPTARRAAGTPDVTDGVSVAAPAQNVIPLTRTVIPFARTNYPRPISGPGSGRTDAAPTGEDDDPGPRAA